MIKPILELEMTKIKLITFDLDDTLWDNGPTITNAELQTRKWIEERVGEVEWGNFEDFIELRNVLIKSDSSIAWDISKLRKEIFKIKINHLVPPSEANILANDAFNFFINKRHEVQLFDGVAKALFALSRKYTLAVLTNGNANIFRFEEIFPESSKFREELIPKSWLLPKEIPLEIEPFLFNSFPPKISSTEKKF